jgi:hypothetical protein
MSLHDYEMYFCRHFCVLRQFDRPLILSYSVLSDFSIDIHLCEISSSHGGEYDVQSCLLGYTAV